MSELPPIRTWLKGAAAAAELGHPSVVHSLAWAILAEPDGPAVALGLQVNGTMYVMGPQSLDALLEGLEAVRHDLARMGLGLELEGTDA